jgi:hypothetical protein
VAGPRIPDIKLRNIFTSWVSSGQEGSVQLCYLFDICLVDFRKICLIYVTVNERNRMLRNDQLSGMR